MDDAKRAVKDFMTRSGHHDTTVHEKVAPAVTHETVTKTKHEDLTTAIDKEVHQDHYHTSVQPVEHQEKLREQHHHNIIPVEHRSFEHGNNDDVQRRLAKESGQFRDETVRQEGAHTQSTAPVVAGEHMHHHVHETIQPVVQKQTIEPHVVHTTVPIHEVHHNSAQHHATSALPPVSLNDFKQSGGVLTGREERYDGFEGEPRSVGHALDSNNAHSGTGSSGLGHNSGSTGTGLGHNSSHTGSTGLGHNSSHTGSGLHGSNTHDSSRTGDTTGTHAGTHKPSMMDKLNPMKDADGDGKKGFMK